MDDEGDSPFLDGYRLGTFTLAAFTAPAAVQMAVLHGREGWILITVLTLLCIGITPQGRWLLRESAWFRVATAINLGVQVVSLVAAWIFDKSMLGAVGVGYAVLVGGFLSLGWQRRLREAHGITDQTIR